MINPPTRPYSEEELIEILKLFPGKKRKMLSTASVTPNPSIEPIQLKIKTPIVVENNVPVIFKNGGDNGSVATVETLPEIDTVGIKDKSTNTLFSKPRTWAIIGGIIIISGAYIYWINYQKKKNARSQSEIKNR